MNPERPRCRHPMKLYELRRYPGQAPDLFPVCWRPAGHPGNRHLSRATLERAREHNRGRSHHARRMELAA